MNPATYAFCVLAAAVVLGFALGYWAGRKTVIAEALRWRALFWRWGSGTITLDYDDKGFCRIYVEHAEAQDEYFVGGLRDGPEELMDRLIKQDDAAERLEIG